MQIKTTYICEYCAKEFESETDCTAHEAKHVTSPTVTAMKFSLNIDKYSGFPQNISLEDPETGNVATYVFNKITEKASSLSDNSTTA